MRTLQGRHNPHGMQPPGALVAYDAGEVALRKSDLDFSDMHQSFGGGISIYLGKDVIFRMAVALGGGEGTHPYFGVANFL
jgi:hypothetical protein